MWNFEFDNGHKGTQKLHVPEFTFLLKWSSLSSSIREFNNADISLNGCSVNFKQCQFCRVYDSLVKNVLEARNYVTCCEKQLADMTQGYDDSGQSMDTKLLKVTERDMAKRSFASMSQQ